MSRRQEKPAIEPLDISRLTPPREFEELLFEPAPAIGGRGPAAGGLFTGPPSLEADPPRLDAPAPTVAPVIGELEADDAPEKLGFSLKAGIGERVRQALRRRGSTEAAPAAQEPDQDPFAAMITPLSQRDLEALRMEVEADTIIFDTVHRIRRAEGNAARGGLILGMLATIAFGLVWRDFFAVLLDIPAPQLLADVAKEHTDVAMYAIGLLCPLFFLLVSVQAGTHLLRALLRRSFVSLIGSLALMTCAGASITLVARQQPIAAIAVAATGMVVGAVINALGEARSSGRGNGQASG